MKISRNTVTATARGGFLALALLFANAGFAETTDFSNVASLIEGHKYDEAEKQIDSVLKNEPNNVNALMYKGNILYFKSSNYGSIQVYGNENESIYDDSMGFISEGSSLVSPQAAKSVAVYFMRALKQAPRRMDIQLGLCWVYANAGLKDELIARFPELRKYSDNKPGLQYNMGDYARIIAENYSFDDGIAVYRAILRLYPDDGNIVNDVAAMYFKKGDLDTALKYFIQAAGRNSRDEKTLENLALMYAIVGDYDKSAQNQKLVSEMNKDYTYLLYQALHKRLGKARNWEADVKEFIRKNQGNERYKDYSVFAESILPVAGKYSFQQFETSKHHKVATQFDIINYEWAAKEFPDQFGAVFDLAEVLSYYQNYRKALPLYERIEKADLARSSEDREKFIFYYAWVLYKVGRIDAANDHWKKLLESQDFYRKSAASYFLGNYHYQNKEFKQAADYFKRVKDQPSKSKYANFSSNLYNQIKKIQ